MSLKKSLFVTFAVSLGISLVFQLSTRSLYDDGWFYSKMAQIFWERGLLSNFPWIYYGTPNGGFTGVHFFFYVLISPFVRIHPVWGLKIFTALSFASLASVFYWILRKMVSGKWAFFGLGIFFLASPDFFFRMNLNRPLNLVVLITLLFCYSLFKKNSLGLMFCGFVMAWLYDGYLVLIALLVLFLAVKLFTEKKFGFLELASGLGGVAWGVIAHPYFPKTWQTPHLSMVNTFKFGKIFDSAEWLPYFFSEPIRIVNLGLIIFALGIMILCANIKKTSGLIRPRPSEKNRKFSELFAGIPVFSESFRKRNLQTIFFFFASSFMLIAMVIWGRFVDFFIPFALLFAIPQIAPDLDRVKFPKPNFRNWPTLLPLFSLAILPAIISLYGVWNVFQWQVGENQKIMLDKISDYLAANSKPRDLVANLEWDLFSRMFFWDDKNYYVAGLNPVFNYAKKKEKFWLWKHLAADEPLTCEQEDCLRAPKQSYAYDKALKEKLSAAWVIFEKKRHPQLVKKMEHSPLLEKSYENEQILLYRVK